MKFCGGMRKLSITWTIPPIKGRSYTRRVSVYPRGQDCIRSAAYRSDEGGTRAQAAGEDIDIAGLLYTAHDLAACHVGVGSVLQPGFIKGKATVVSTGRMQAGKNMVLQD